ncbi:MAG: flagellar assembly peptidoglycan hydrolase FlgJ [Burkholderiaceae bacterium]|jgi:flagellar protein FlgJ|nr:flagellar assembly peptidoglycan hydrolase FlgJ [Burkholderiaceae bacterium]
MSTLPTAGLAGDAQSLAALRGRAATDPKTAVREVAKQFEALFMQELMKSMRAATLSSGMLDNEGSKLGTDLLDQQFATQMTGLPGGLSEAITRQLERQMGMAPGPIPVPTAVPLQPERAVRIPDQSAAGFVQQHAQAARDAERATGIPAAFMIGQAAHESGWGRREIRHADGTPSHNLFGIKAGADWKGAVAETATTEYVDGRAVKTVARFRAYASHAESFADYARLMKDSPRYQRVLAQGQDAGSFAAGLQRAGYATDPAYAEKLTRVINTALRLQRSST